MNPCPICGGQMKAPLGLNALSRSTHNGRNVYVCPRCGEREAMIDFMAPSQTLPRFCYHDGDNGPVMIVRGVEGFIALGKAFRKTPAKKLNDYWGVSEDQAGFMTARAMFGWYVAEDSETTDSEEGMA